VKVQFEEWQRSSLKLTFLGRPFITGGSLEPHSLLWAARYGPGGSDLFNRVAARLVSPTLSDARDLRLTTAPLRVHYSPVDAWTFYESLLGLIDADNTQPLLTIGTGSKPARHRRLDECSIAIHRSGARLVVATPKGVHEITEAQWQLIRWVTEQPRIDQAQAHSDATTWRLLRDGVAAGWLEPLHTDLAAPS